MYIPPALLLKKAAEANFQQVVVIGVQTDGTVKIIQSQDSAALVERVAQAILHSSRLRDDQSRTANIA
jgi:hypothetical protein